MDQCIVQSSLPTCGGRHRMCGVVAVTWAQRIKNNLVTEQPHEH